ncbi:calcium permease family membrane transporter GPCR family [Pseudocercospora fijiensis CIRAD86]|uniref:Calcium permease family membrane transporter GPCR family n=1 Tax=Pseudocercospora fijiensis (strain CIRAD86) TaxID=383855 RepID=M3AID4_PSEFD|nr:calcium permease family membrane transporter GPCR family [Pseudocercospora fijiensis CIRAD86]EME76968.1 calcium permease family membrane transporter GPCR family [Pseudocercospora fijiensis CIRAD86]
MADDSASTDERSYSIGVHDYAAVPSNTTTAAPNTRRTSVSSAGTMSRNQEQQSSYASMQASQGSLSQADSTLRRPRARQDYGSMHGSSSGGGGGTSSRLTPQVTQQPPKRPTAGGRKVSTQAPHRGEIFSVDDDANEVEEDTRQHRSHSKTDVHRERDRERPLRRRESTVRRRGPPPTPSLPRVESQEDEEEAEATGADSATIAAKKAPSVTQDAGEPSSEDTLQGEEEEEEETPSPDEDDSADLSDAESFTLKDRQEAINETHPFGIRIWKPALYKKSRSVQRNAEGDIHSAPGGNVSRWLWLFNGLWTLIFGWWLAIITSVGGVICLFFGLLQPGSSGSSEYGRVLINLAHYLFYPFGKYVRLERDEAYLHEDEGEGRDIAEYERWQAGDIEEGRLFFGPPDINRSLIGRRREEVPDLEDNETDPLLGRTRPSSAAERAQAKTKKRLFGRGEWNLGRVIFFLSFYLLITPCLFIVSGICWFLVFTIPMGKVTLLLFYHLRRHPLAMSFHTDSHYQRTPSMPRGSNDSVILLCTYRAVGIKYWKYTLDGTNIFLINLLGLVFFAIFDYFVLYETLHINVWITSPGFVFVIALASIIPLAYFIGQAVASISAQSSMGVGATINAFFSTIVEVFLYCVALDEGKAQLVEGSIIGSIFAGILFLPGLSMCFGAIKRKTQRFNVKSAGVTSTMLLFAVIGCFGPTLFYQFYGSHILNCKQCIDLPRGSEEERDCRRCYFTQVPEINDEFFNQAVRPYVYFCTVCLFLSYVVGLLFTLRTHAAVIWNNEPEEERKAKYLEHQQHQHVSMPYTAGLVSVDSHQATGGAKKADGLGTLAREDIRSSQMYRRILNQSLKQAGIMQSPTTPTSSKRDDTAKPDDQGPPHIVPPKSAGNDSGPPTATRVQGLSPEDNRALVQQVAEIAATAATVAARDATKAPRRTSVMATTVGAPGAASRNASCKEHSKDPNAAHPHDHDLPPDPSHPVAHEEQGGHGGHDAPNWSRKKSAIILLTATIAYAIIAEILVDTVDVVLSSIAIPEKFLGITLFSLVPNTTEFLNAISFAVNGNVALSMEIGSSYALQVVLLQVPCLVLFTAIYGRFIPADQLLNHSFTLIFPQWDMVVVLLSVFLFGWIVGEGKSNYFKGSILIFTYLVVVVGFWFAGYNSMDTMGIDRFDTLALGVETRRFLTVGHGRSGIAVPEREL